MHKRENLRCYGTSTSYINHSFIIAYQMGKIDQIFVYHYHYSSGLLIFISKKPTQHCKEDYSD